MMLEFYQWIGNIPQMMEKMKNMNALFDVEGIKSELLNTSASTDEYFVGYFDGASRGNPGRAGAGIWISRGNKEIIWENSIMLGVKTNNEAEYSALIYLLNEFHARAIKKAEIRGDSKLVIEQMSGRWKVKEPRLIELWKKAKLLTLDTLYTFEWIPREQNSYADKLSNMAIDSHF
jgi:ribonuclease HI